jgi:hypothetical protein
MVCQHELKPNQTIHLTRVPLAGDLFATPFNEYLLFYLFHELNMTSKKPPVRQDRGL